MATLSLRISIPEKNATKMMQFDPSTSVYDACRIIREKLAEATNMGQPKDYGLFLADEDIKKGVWLEPGRNLDYYILRNGDLLEYRRKLRTLRVRMLDGTLKTLLVDDSQPVANLMVVICTKIGITNHDEYSLVRDFFDEETENQKPGNFGTLTLKRRKEEKGERDAKMDQLRKKLKTDDEVNWIDPSKTLREQGIDESETVLLRRKYFFSDQNIDSRDPVQLSLLYVQARDAILDGTHPVTQEKACTFAGIQCQIQFGDYKEDKHKPGFLDLKEFLPQSYLKVKGIEKKVFAEHKKHVGLSELDAKVLYTKTARSLSTYGVTFFLVKEKMIGKNKLVPRLLGVTKDSVLRLDERTKEILKTWPLTTVRRWGASPNTFTLDFGDYSDQYYSVQTTEAEQILQLIAGYIDIILKKQKAKDHFGIEGDEGSTMVEDSVSPLKATIMQHETSNVGKGNVEAVSVAIPAVMRVGGDGARPYGTGHMGGAQYTTVSGQVNIAHAPPMVQQTRVTSVLTEPQRALLSRITAGHEIIHMSEVELTTKAQLPELGSDPASLRWIEQTMDTHKQNVGSQIAEMNAATAQVVTLTSGPADDVDHTAVGAAITTIATNLPEMTKGVRMIAALMEDDTSGLRLLDAARKLCTAFSDLLKATEPETKEPRQNLLNAASRVGEASHQVLTTIGEENETNRELQDMLLALAKAVANTTAALVLKARNIAATCEDSQTQNRVISAATQCALATSQLVACAKVVAPTLQSPACQTQLMNAVREVTKAVEGLVDVCNETCSDENLLKELSLAAAEVSRTLNDLLNHIRTATRSGERATTTVQEIAVETIMSATDRLFASSGDAGEMVRQAKIVGQATAQLIQSIKGEAERQTDTEQLRKLLAAAKKLADATAKMVEAARQCASSPQDPRMQDQLRDAAINLRNATNAASTPSLRRKVVTEITETYVIDKSQFVRAAQAIHEGCGNLRNPSSTKQQVLEAATMIAKHTSALCNACRSASSKTNDPVSKRHFVQSAKDVANSTANLVKEIKSLDRDYSENNRERCSTATRPLLEAVDNLCEFAGCSTKEFSILETKTEVIEVREETHETEEIREEPMSGAGKAVIDGACAMVETAKSLAASPKDEPTWQLLAHHSKNVSESIKTLVASIRDKTPGQEECDAAIEKLVARIRELDSASLSAVSQSLMPRKENSSQGFIDQMDRSVSELREKLEPLRVAAKYEPDSIASVVNDIAHCTEPLVSGAIGAASNMVHSKQQAVLLDQTKTVTESALQLIYVTKEAGGNPEAAALHAEIDETVESTKDTIRELQNTLESISTSNGIVTGLIETISRATMRLEEHRSSTVDTVDSFVEYQTRMVEAAKEIARLAQEMSTKSSTDVGRLGPLAVDISHKYTQLARDTSGASAAASNADVSSRLRSGVQELGRACADIVRAAGVCQLSPGDVYAQREVAENGKIVTEKVSQVLAALQAGSRGTQACINAASTVSGIIGDLDTTIMFATAGTLHAENEGDTFADHRENILKTAKALVEDTKTLVAGAASSQEQLAVAAQNAVSTIVQLAEVVKYGAASLGSQNSEAQVMLINAVKDVASALGDLIHATKAASGKPINDPSMAHLKDSAKVMVTNVTSLLKTVKAVEDEHTRGTRALESTIEAIGQEIRALNTPDSHKIVVTPEDLVRCTKGITTATAKAVAAGNSCKQDDIIAAANLGRKSISDMLAICKSAAYNCAETTELRDRTLQAGHDVAMNYRELLQSVLQISSRSSDAKHTLPIISRKIAQSVTELVAVAELLKGNDWVDPDDPTVIAENELLGAAASIDAAAKKLASLRPRRSIQETSEDMNFDEMILEAAKSIAAATSALIKAASAAQRELIATGKVSRTPLTSSDDGQWSEGLISAARLVAAATHSLVESANALVQGVSSEEKLISSAKQVASSTAQLLVACKVKADPDSDNTKRLQAAGNAVKRATDNLVRAAQQAIQQEEERSLVLNRRMVGGMAQEIDARSEVLRIERELEEARGRLTAIRQAKYTQQQQMESKSFEERQPSGKGFNQALENLQSSGNQIGHIANDRENLVSPEKVHSTQSTLERRMKENQYRDGSYGTLESRKFNDSPDYQYSTLDSQRSRFGSNDTSSERIRYPSSDTMHSYTITDRVFPTDNSPAQYSSIERKINQESYDTNDRTNDLYDTTSSKIPLRKNQDSREPIYAGKNLQNQQQEEFLKREKSFESSVKKIHESSQGPPPPPLPQMPRSPVRKNINESSFGKFSQEQHYHEDKQTSFEKRSNENLDPSYFPPVGTTSTIVNERFTTSTPMSTFRSEKSSDQHTPPRSYIATAGIPQSQTYKNVDNKVIPGGRIETITTKIYTSAPGKSSSSSSSTNFEKMEKNEFSTSGNDMSTFKALDSGNKESLEQRTIKQSTLQKVTEKKTVTMTTSKRHESNTKSFRFEEKK
ncbi:talin-2 isoform X2 [Venturia canescens]|uniref:talin-2 isoform X2 n=1 Tax=Venturia canescens TaxID=32260 RepID=UPI001C9CAF66|nr:talin-2 isoform X2 [Venturia canescens]